MNKKLPGKGKKLPKLKSVEEMAHFVETTDMSDYINAKIFVFTGNVFEFASKDKTLTMRLPAQLLAAVKARAAKKRMPYQRFIRAVRESAVSGNAR